MSSYLSDASFITKLGFNLLQNRLDSQPLMNTTVYNYFWNLSDPLLNVAHQMAPSIVPVKNMGILHQVRETRLEIAVWRFNIVNLNPIQTIESGSYLRYQNSFGAYTVLKHCLGDSTVYDLYLCDSIAIKATLLGSKSITQAPLVSRKIKWYKRMGKCLTECEKLTFVTNKNESFFHN